jgi:hypothetical protein
VGRNWECPYCGKGQVVARERRDFHRVDLNTGESYVGLTSALILSTVCANSDCRKLTFTMVLQKRTFNSRGEDPLGDIVHNWQLMPESSAKPLPDYIPEPLRQDYIEACRIRDLSPKASATLSRRCLQGMIRDFCGIARKRLVDEINGLRSAVSEGKAPAGVQPDTIDAIDHVRSIGNIGAHMEADINHLVDVDPDEAQSLLELLELLFEEWYVARQVRNDRLAKIGVVAANKAAAKLAPPAIQLPPPSKP